MRISELLNYEYDDVAVIFLVVQDGHQRLQGFWVLSTDWQVCFIWRVNGYYACSMEDL